MMKSIVRINSERKSKKRKKNKNRFRCLSTKK
jgi:hypothetical protein